MRLQVLLTLAVAVDLLVFSYVSSYDYPWVSAFIRPFFFLLLFRNLRNYFTLYLRVVKESLPMVTFIAIYIFTFSWIAYTIFQGTL